MARKVGRGSEQFVLRLPDGMRDQIAAAAEESGRSMNAEIVARLEASLDAGRPDGSLANLEKSLQELKASLEKAIKKKAVG